MPNVSKTRKMIIDVRREESVPSSLWINGVVVQSTDSFKFLGFTITPDLSWAKNCSLLVKRCQTHLYFLRQLEKFAFRHMFLAQFYHSVIDSILFFGVSGWFSATALRDKAHLERWMRQVSRIAGCDFPSMASLYNTRLCRRASKLSDNSFTEPTTCSIFFPPVGATEPLRPRLAGLGLASSRRLFGSCSPFLLLFRYMSGSVGLTVDL